MKHFKEILDKISPSIDEKSQDAYNKFKENVLDFRPSYVG